MKKRTAFHQIEIEVFQIERDIANLEQELSKPESGWCGATFEWAGKTLFSVPRRTDLELDLATLKVKLEIYNRWLAEAA